VTIRTRRRRIFRAVALAAMLGAATWESAGQDSERAAPPQAPPLPFVYAGKLAIGASMIAVLTRQERSYFVRPGDTLEGTYRVEALDGQRIVLKHLPLGIEQTLLFTTSDAAASAARASGAQASGAPPAVRYQGTPGVVLAPPILDPALQDEEETKQ
jgi:hypothetical protein